MEACEFHYDPDGQSFCGIHERAAPGLCVDAAAELAPLLSAGATCSTCGFRYAEHEGHIIPCPRCAAAEVERAIQQRTIREKPLEEALWDRGVLPPTTESISNWLEKLHQAFHGIPSGDGCAICDVIGFVARLEEEKAQVKQSLTIYKQEYATRCDDLEQAEARAAALREALAQIQAIASGEIPKADLVDDTEALAYVDQLSKAALSPDAGRAKE